MIQCFAANEFEQVQATAQLSLGTDPPMFHELFQAQILDAGPSLSIKCSASGSPIPQITWSLDDAPLPESNRVRYGDYVTKVGLWSDIFTWKERELSIIIIIIHCEHTDSPTKVS